MHNASFAQQGVDAAYLVFEVDPDQLAEVVHTFKTIGGIPGYNVSMPNKMAICEHLDELTDAARDLVAKRGTDKIYGARPLRRAIQTLIEDPLAEQMLMGNWASGDIIYVDVKEDGESLSFTKGAGEITAPEERVHMEIAPARNQWTAPRVIAPDSASAE
jgi:hypothetical protein